MTVITDFLKDLQLAEPMSSGPLSVFPLLGGAPAEPPPAYLVLQQALEAGLAEVTEISEGGSVPVLAFVNHGDQPVLLLDGEELIGAKQNRILNLSIMAPPKDRIEIPVSCVEAGRWSSRSRKFGLSERAMYAEARRFKARDVSASMRREGSRRSDQGAIWDDIGAKAERMMAFSETGAMGAMFDQKAEDIEAFAADIAPRPGQVGAVFVIGGAITGIDIFDHPAVLAAYLPKLLRSQALDVIDRSRQLAGEPDREPVAALLAEIGKALFQRFPGVGLGEDVRLHGRVGGGALLVNGKVVHLFAFPEDSRTAETRIVR